MMIDGEGKQLGLMKTFDAINLASEKELDLVEVSPPYDNAGATTCLLAANLVHEFISLLALQRKISPKETALNKRR